MENKYGSKLESGLDDEKTSPLEFLKRMDLIAYACFKYPFNSEDVYVDFKKRKVTLLK